MWDSIFEIIRSPIGIIAVCAVAINLVTGLYVMSIEIRKKSKLLIRHWLILLGIVVAIIIVLSIPASLGVIFIAKNSGYFKLFIFLIIPLGIFSATCTIFLSLIESLTKLPENPKVGTLLPMIVDWIMLAVCRFSLVILITLIPFGVIFFIKNNTYTLLFAIIIPVLVIIFIIYTLKDFIEDISKIKKSPKETED